MRLILLALLVLLAAPAGAAEAQLLAELDALHARRAEPSAVKEQEAALKKALQSAPGDFELAWRVARLRQWEADSASDARLKKALGKQTWDLGERALKLAPERVEGHLYAALGIGAYSQAVGIMKALGEGLESKFNERLDKAIQLDGSFDRGAPLIAKGRYFYELPWPKRDLAKSAALFEQVAAKFPENLRAHLFLAQTLLADDEPKKAQEAIQKVKKGNTAYDPAEGRRVQEWAKKVEAEIQEELK